MLEVSEAVKEAYINGNAKTEIFLTVTTTDNVVHEYNARNILSGSVSIVESLCSAETFDISRVEKNQLTFTLFNITEGIKGLQGASVVAKQRITLPDENETAVDIPLGTYTVVEAMNDGDYLYKCTCYDTTTLNLDGLIDDWWKGLTFPITLRNLVVSMFDYLGCPYDIPAEFNNYDYSVPAMNAVFEGVTGAEILGYIQEIVGGYFKANRFGVITLRVPVPTASGLYPHIGLYPHTGLYPRRSSSGFGVDGEVGIGDWNYPQIVGDLQIGDYDVKRVTKVQIRGTEDDIGIIAGSGTNTYVIQGNPLLFNLTDETGRAIAENILSAVGQVAYKPFSGKFMSQPYIEVGDMAKIMTLEQKEGVSPIFQRTLSGARLAFDTFQCLGLEEREQVSSVNRKMTTINQRTHEVINTVDELKSTVTQVENTVETHSTQISQNANAITLQAQRTGFQNYIVNGDFSDMAEPLRGWILTDVKDGGIVEVVDDPRFANGKACHFVQGENQYAITWYDIDFGEEINLNGKKIVIYEQIENIATSNVNEYLHVRCRTKSASGVFSTLFNGNVAKGSGVGYVRFAYTVTRDTIVTGLRLLPLFGFTGDPFETAEGKFGMVCVLIVDADEEIPARGFYTDLPKNNLVSQINIEPSGVKIRGEKIDIWGVTTIHNSDGSGSTTLTGSTIKSATIETATLKGNSSSLTFDMSTDTVEYKMEMKPGAIVQSGETMYGIKFDDVNNNGAFVVESKNILLEGSAVSLISSSSPRTRIDVYGDNITTAVGGRVRTVHLTNRATVFVPSDSEYYTAVGISTEGIDILRFSSQVSFYINGSGYTDKTFTFKTFKATDGNNYVIPCIQV